jgi:hypothetical protein
MLPFQMGREDGFPLRVRFGFSDLRLRAMGSYGTSGQRLLVSGRTFLCFSAPYLRGAPARFGVAPAGGGHFSLISAPASHLCLSSTVPMQIENCKIQKSKCPESGIFIFSFC